jgi:hypothetical protein
MQTREIARRRMYGHRLWGEPMATPEGVVGAFAAMQAQEFVPAKWMVAQRTSGTSESAIDEAFAAGSILRTHVVRPTWHFVRREDVRWLLEITAPRVNQLNAYYYRKFGLDDAVFDTCAKLFRKTLKGGKQLTRRELAAVLEKAGIQASGLQLGYILMRAELDAVLISGAPRGRQQTYALFDDRVPYSTSLDKAAALAALTTRYFTMRGPATVKDFALWSNLTVTEAKRGLGMIRAQVEDQEIGGRTYYAMPERAHDAPASPVIDLIQGYDECVMSYSESKDVLFGIGEPAAASPAFLHTILLDGQILGHWKHTSKARSVLVETSFHRRLTAEERAALDAAVARFGDFMGVPAAWR